MSYDFSDALRVCVVLAAGIAVIIGGVGVGFSQTAPPNSYYGIAESASETVAPQGTTIVAVANGKIQDSITVGTNGQYGGSDPTDEKLRISSEIDSPITFHIDNASGPQAEETDPDPTGEVERLDLTFPAGTFGGPTTSQSDTPTPTPTPSATPTPTPTPTSTPTPAPTPTPMPTSTPTPTSTRTPAQTETSTPTQTDAPMSTPTKAETAIAPQTDEPDTDEAGNNAPATRTDARAEPDIASTASPAVDSTATALNSTEADTVTTTESQSGGGLIPWGLLRTGFTFVVLPIALIYGVLKALAVYYGY